MRRFAAIFAFLFLSLAAAGRPALLVRLWQSEDGLPGNVVRSLVQDAEGYLWVATAEGIARFDGMEFETIEPEGEMRRLRFAFWRLFATPDGSVWAATFQGGLFQVSGGRLVRVLDDMARPLVTQLLADSRNAVFFRRGDDYWEIRDGRAMALEQVPADLLERFAKDEEAQSRGGHAVTPDSELQLYSRDGRLWSAGEAGNLIVEDSGGSPAIPVTLPGAAYPYTFQELLEDREGNVWIATAIHGLARVRFSRVDALGEESGLHDRTPVGLLQDSGGVWWIAGRRSSVTRWTPESWEHFRLSPSGIQRPAAAMFEDRDKRLWIASRDGSVFLRKDDGFEPQFVKTQVPSKVRTIQQDAGGTLWFGGSQGIASYDGGAVTGHTIDPPGDVTVMTTAPSGEMLAGTSDGRVLIGGEKGFIALGDAPALRHRWISGLLARSADEVWATTLGGGLFLWNGRAWTQFGEEAGIPELRLTSILDDGRGHFWFGSLGGILRASRGELLARAVDADMPLHWLRLDRSDGLPSRECIGGYQPAAWRAQDGRLWFPNGNGIVRIDPGLVEINRVPPPVHLRSARVNGRLHENGAQSIEAGPGRSRVEFRFAGLSYLEPEKVTYRARLAGLDDTWRELGHQRVAAFEAVPPGRYTFEVLAVNGDGIWSETPARMPLVVRPHFWEAAWFLVTAGMLTLLVAAGIGWGIARSRMKGRIQRLKLRHAREAERTRIARDLHDDLGASLTEISILTALAAETGGENGMRPVLDQLSGKAKEVVGTLDEIVWAVNPREDTLRSLIDYLAAFAREFLDRARIPLRTDIPRHIPDQPLDTTVRHGVFLAAREALNNLVKHSQATQARLAVVLDHCGLEIRIEDNGRGFSQEWEAKGYGIRNLRERMLSCGGDCRIAGTPGGGVTVALTLPPLAPSTAST